MNKTISIALMVVAAVLLVTGYTAPARFEKALSLKRAVRSDVKKFDTEMNRKYPLAHEHALTNEQLAPFESLDDSNEKQNAALIGTVQYCAGWIVLSMAAGLWCFPIAKRG